MKILYYQEKFLKTCESLRNKKQLILMRRSKQLVNMTKQKQTSKMKFIIHLYEMKLQILKLQIKSLKNSNLNPGKN